MTTTQKASKTIRPKENNFAKKYCPNPQKFCDNILFSADSKLENFGAKKRSKQVKK